MCRGLFFCIAALLFLVRLSSAFAPLTPGRLTQRGLTNQHTSSVLNLSDPNSNDDDKDENNNDVSDDGDMSSFPKPTGSTDFVSNIQSAVVAAGWTFVGLGVLLNIFGYDYVVRDGKLGVDTMEAAQFQKEINKAARSSRASSPDDMP